MTHKAQNITIKNKKAFFEYEILETFVAGIQLVGTEIKSIRSSKVSLVDSYCQFQMGELYVKNMHISEYDFGNINNHEAKRDRKLLLQKRELGKLVKKLKESGLTIVPLKLFIIERGLAKLEIALAKGKKVYDKRETLKEKDSKRDMDRAMKH
ncbi:MAG: SsrA-binding protein [Bacteroidetes bacterium GWF2_42_66]|nr:MAG: SsrA-binding protein [Bacteroidetes bacterium GWE2_42_39]OFY47179.1 MAG: SsrA-binding protein [Bacteroidetes bacterium GWF2_42_66]HBL76627.1 SsrA-binding protein [Prolixibacteraceae bacterium]HCR88922.1 SsrA-binding protein [Prolixibacteraceae bacterium]HCU62992.1 SsrA-binding protein [Prolixibacteraceae bacterium]